MLSREVDQSNAQSDLRNVDRILDFRHSLTPLVHTLEAAKIIIQPRKEMEHTIPKSWSRYEVCVARNRSSRHVLCPLLFLRAFCCLCCCCFCCCCCWCRSRIFSVVCDWNQFKVLLCSSLCVKSFFFSTRNSIGLRPYLAVIGFLGLWTVFPPYTELPNRTKKLFQSKGTVNNKFYGGKKFKNMDKNRRRHDTMIDFSPHRAHLETNSSVSNAPCPCSVVYGMGGFERGVARTSMGCVRLSLNSSP